MKSYIKKRPQKETFFTVTDDKIVSVRDDDLPNRCRDRFIPYSETKMFLNFWENGLNSKRRKRKAERSILFGRFCDKMIRRGNREICVVSTGKTPRLIMMRESWHTVPDHTWQECRTREERKQIVVSRIPIAEIGIGATTTVKGLCHGRQSSLFAVLFTIASFHFLSS